MKRCKLLFLISLLFVGILCAVHAQVQPTSSYEDGTYRGVYGEVDNQVTIEFTLKDNKVTRIAFRNLAYRGISYLTTKDDTVEALKEQYTGLINYLIGKDIRVALKDLYKPGEIVKTTAVAKRGNPVRNVDAFSGATLRAGKIISAIRDALNRGVYSY